MPVVQYVSRAKNVCFFTDITVMCAFDFVLDFVCVLVCSHVRGFVYVSACWVGAGTVIDGKHTPIPQPP